MWVGVGECGVGRCGWVWMSVGWVGVGVGGWVWVGVFVFKKVNVLYHKVKVCCRIDHAPWI